MSTLSIKQQVQEILNRLPDNCTLEDVQYQLYVAQKVSKALEDVDTNGGITNEDARIRLQPWLSK